jgi:release factor glutamine methyltransferase
MSQNEILNLIPVHERRILEAHVRGVSELDEYQKKELKRLILERTKGFPLQYLIGSQNFYGYDYYVNTSVLIPRPETEGLVELCLKKFLPPSESYKRIFGLEFGTGSGCIANTLALERKDLILTATDCSEDALLVAEENARKYGIGNVNFVKTSENLILEEYIKLCGSEKFLFLISNPPYLCKENGECTSEVLEYEPEVALFAPSDDLLKYYKFCALIFEKLVDSNHGFALFEVSHLRAQDTALVFEQIPNTKVEILKDLNQMDRYLVVRRSL